MAGDTDVESDAEKKNSNKVGNNSGKIEKSSATNGEKPEKGEFDPLKSARQNKRAGDRVSRRLGVLRSSKKNKEGKVGRQQSYASTDADYNGFQYQKRRRYKKRLEIAEVIHNQNENNFTREHRRLWLYIYLVKRSANDKIIHKYITSKAGFEESNVMVKENPSPSQQLKRFLIVGPMSKKDKLYDPSFWPKNVEIERFNFKRHKEFLAS